MKKINQILQVVEKKHLQKLPILVLFMLTCTFFELLNIGILIPILTIFKNENNFFILNFVNIFKTSKENFMFTLLIILLFIVILKNLVVLLFENYKTRFGQAVQNDLTQKLFLSYHSDNVLLIKKISKSNYIKNLNNEISIFRSKAFEPLVKIISEIIILLSILVFLLIYNFKVNFFLISIFCFFSLILLKISKKKNIDLGVRSTSINSQIIKILDDIYSNFKQIKISLLENLLAKSLIFKIDKRSSYNRHLLIISKIPKSFFEIIAVFIVIGLYFYFVKVNYVETIEFITFIVIVMASLYRLIPSVNNILICKQQIDFANKAIEIISSEIINKHIKIENDYNVNLEFEEIELRDFSVKYNSRTIFEKINLIIRKNERIFISGASGIGKTTLIESILGFEKNYDGKIIINKKNSFKIRSFYNQITYNDQDPFFYNDTIRANLFPDNSLIVNENEIEGVLNQVGLMKTINLLPDKLDTEMGENAHIFSAGMKQRLAIARSLLKKPKIAFFDEATNALDSQLEIEIIKLILKKIDTVFFVSHNLEIKNFFDKKYKIENFNLIPFNDKY